MAFTGKKKKHKIAQKLKYNFIEYVFALKYTGEVTISYQKFNTIGTLQKYRYT